MTSSLGWHVGWAYGKGLFPELRITHLIDRKRVQRDYLLQIAEGHAFSHAILDHLHGRPISPPESLASLAAVMASVGRGSVSGFLSHSLRWWNRCRRSELEAAFSAAAQRGLERAFRMIKGDSVDDSRA